jgi:DNA polymerase (family 10)
MSQTNLRLSLKVAEDLAARIAAELAPVCERIEIAGSIRRRRETVGDIELVCIARHSPSLIPGVPGVSLLELALVAMAQKGKLIPAGRNEGERLKKYYLPALHHEGHDLKLEINISDAERWPVELAIKTGPAEFSKCLVTHRRDGGFLPTYCQIKSGWQVWEGQERRQFESERAFIEWACGEWIEPRDRK